MGRPLLYTLFVGSILALAGALVLAIVMGTSGYYGYDKGTPIVITFCPNAYPVLKYTQQNIMLRVCFMLMIIAVICWSTLLVIMIVWVIRVCQNAPPALSMSRPVKVGMYVLVSVSLLCVVSNFGYYMAFEA